MIKLLITDTGYLCESQEKPEVGKRYFLQDAVSGTEAQNKAFHALVGEYWRSGMHSYTASNYEEFRGKIKMHLGTGFEAYIYVGDDNRIHDAKTIDEIPAEIRRHPEMRSLVRGRLKSWSKYTKRERIDTLDKLIAEMIQAGVNSNKFQEILEGMEDTK